MASTTQVPSITSYPSAADPLVGIAALRLGPAALSGSAAIQAAGPLDGGADGAGVAALVGAQVA